MSNFWKTSDGKILRISDMETSHLERVIDYFATWPDDYLPDGYHDIVDELAFRNQGIKND